MYCCKGSTGYWQPARPFARRSPSSRRIPTWRCASAGGRVPPLFVAPELQGIAMNAIEDPISTTPQKRSAGPGKLTFARANEFQADLRQRVDGYFASSGRRRRDCSQAYVKTAIFL